MIETFGHIPDGQPVYRLTLTGGGLTAGLLTYGAVVHDLRLDGHDQPLVLGFPEFPPYLTHSPHFGAIAGRCANRVRDGHVELDGQTFQLDQNFRGRHMLHGGAGGAGKRLWQVLEHGKDRASLEITLEDGHMGFPGNLMIRADFALLAEGVLDIRLRAESDATTLCNLAHHSYFNLSGETSVLNHEMRLAASSYLPVNDDLIPTGEVRDVAGTNFDFLKFTDLTRAKQLDHNFCLSDTRLPLRPVGWLRSQASGVSMELRTTEPGLQVYTGEFIDISLPGLTGQSMGSNAGIAMEPQIWPDANHHPTFPQAVLRAGETYDQHTQYFFSKG